MSIGEIDNVNFGLRRGTLMNQPTYPFALRQDKKSFSTFIASNEPYQIGALLGPLPV